MTAVLEESDRILGNLVLTAHSVVSLEGHSRCAERARSAAAGRATRARGPLKRDVGQHDFTE
jgi:hypothetical protein